MATIDKCGEGMKKDLKRALDRFGKTEQQLGGDVKIIKDWLITQPHLPEISSNNHIINTLILNKFSVEICKQRLDMFYTIRTLLPEIYERMDFELMIEIAIVYISSHCGKRHQMERELDMSKLLTKTPIRWIHIIG
ncbi:hypothetical protein JTB14_037184 [Gonioctena quinquepunctata]|nr:hypothetical protein JTB14_037184 [Gonioctena quinquepunctata]